MEFWTQLSTIITGLFFGWTILQKYFPFQPQPYLEKYFQNLVTFFYPFIQVSFHESTGEYLKHNEAYSFIRNYLTENSTKYAKRLKANVVKDCQSFVLSMDDYEEVVDEFNGIKLWWTSNKISNNSQTISWYPSAGERRYYMLTFHKRHRELVTKLYIDHVLKEGKSIGFKNRQRKLYTNNPGDTWYDWNGRKWSYVVFEHPANFDTLAMANKKKEEIMKDLIKFSKGKEYYAKMGKAWKRGYLLYGPPGTGKSTMIAAMANLLEYDVYDLELTTVKDNSELRKLLMATTSKSIILIEDIDCSVDLTGKRKGKKEEEENDNEENEKDPVLKKRKEKEEEESKKSKVTLSGLLNFIDGIWSACGGERIIVFTTNYIEKLDPALIRRGRMDKHIEMSYCCFEGFKVLAKNYLDAEFHELFGRIEELLGEVNMTPADVAENLMPKSDNENVETCLRNLISALEVASEKAKKKVGIESKLKDEEEGKAVMVNGFTN